MLRRAIDSFHPRHQPWITRQSYKYELANALTFPVALAMIEGGVVGVLAQKAFNVGPFVFAAIQAAPMFANLTSFVWAWASRGRPKVAFINKLQIATLACVAAIAILPTVAPTGPLLLMALVVLARCLLSGVITLRSLVWRMNYPRHLRAQITGKWAVLQSVIFALVPLLGYAAMDFNEDAFRVIYPLSVVFATLGVLHFSRIRLRGERELLAYERTPEARPQPHGAPSPIYEYDPKGAQTRPEGRANFWTVLRHDRAFRNYMLWQFVGGAANMMGEVVMVAAVAQMTAGLSSEYFTAIVLTTAIPMLFSVITLPYWARLLDRIHIVEFRARQGWWWILNQFVTWAGLGVFVAFGWFWTAIVIVAASRVIQGVTRGAGMLAWNLGHNDFADRRMVAVYMGIHVTLTGVRGAFCPFLAMGLYAGWNAVAVAGVTLVPGYEGIGYHIFLVTTAMAIAAEIGFHAMQREMGDTSKQKTE